MSDTVFRQLLEQLRGNRGDAAHWTVILQSLFEHHLQQERKIDRVYEGQSILIDRREHGESAVSPENKLVYGLFRNLWKDETGPQLITIGQDVYFPLSCQVPNQGSHRGRRIDLLAMTQAGSLAVFEFKVAENQSDTVLAAVLEALDYLACLLGAGNMQRISDEFGKLKHYRLGPDHSFCSVHPNEAAVPEVIVVAPKLYYEAASRSPRGTSGEWLRNSTAANESDVVRIRFAVTEVENDRFTQKMTWVTENSWPGLAVGRWPV